MFMSNFLILKLQYQNLLIDDDICFRFIFCTVLYGLGVCFGHNIHQLKMNDIFIYF